MAEQICIPEIKLDGSTATILFAIAYSWAPIPTSKLNKKNYFYKIYFNKSRLYNLPKQTLEISMPQF